MPKSKLRPVSFTVKRPCFKGRTLTKRYKLKVNRCTQEREDDYPPEDARIFDGAASDLALDDGGSDHDSQQDCQEDGQPAVTGYEWRKIKETQGWHKLRNKMYKVTLEEDFMEQDQPCIHCEEIQQQYPAYRPIVKMATCRCKECGVRQFYCNSCALVLHSTRNVYHILEVWQDDHFKPLFPNSGVIGISCKRGCALELREMVVVDYKGRQHMKKVQFCNCEEDAYRLIRLGLWPASCKKPVAAFHMDFMDMAGKFLLESQVSLFKFCSTMAMLSSEILPQKIKSIYPILNSKSFEEYRFFAYNLKNLSCDTQLPKDFCILCPKPEDDDVLIESMDGCFGLIRKKSAGKSSDVPFHGTSLFADQDDVDNFVKVYSAEKTEAENECSQFKSGEVTEKLRSKGKNNLLDITGVFGRVCRHGIPKGFLNMRHGERIAYSVYELKRILDRYKDSSVSLHVTYDVSCTLKRHLEVNEMNNFVEAFKFAIPVMHCYGHKMACQILYNPRRLKNFGLTDGEAIERLWSYLRPYSSMTKEMAPTSRINLLTDALFHLTWRKHMMIGKELEKKLKHCEKTKQQAAEEIHKIQQDLSVTLTQDRIQSWQAEQENMILRKKDGNHIRMNSWQDEYADMLMKLCQMQNQLAASSSNESEEIHNLISKNNRQEAKVKSLEKKYCIRKRWKPGDSQLSAAVSRIARKWHSLAISSMQILATERHFLCNLKKKYADGQAIAKRVSKNINRVTNSLKRSVTQHNAQICCFKMYSRLVPDPLKFDDVKEPNGAVYGETENSEFCINEQLPLSLKQKIIENNLLLQRCEEEADFLQTEVKRFHNFLASGIRLLDLQTLEIDCKWKFDRGLKNRLRQRALELKYHLNEHRGLFAKFGIVLHPDHNQEVFHAELCGVETTEEFSSDKMEILQSEDYSEDGSDDEESILYSDDDILFEVDADDF